MGELLLWALATGLGTVLIIALVVWSERRDERRYESWRCPRCGTAFGRQPRTAWSARVDPRPSSGVPTSGPALSCATCAREYWFGDKGQLVRVFGRGERGKLVEEERPPELSSKPGRTT